MTSQAAKTVSKELQRLSFQVRKNDRYMYSEGYDNVTHVSLEPFSLPLRGRPANDVSIGGTSVFFRHRQRR